MLRLGFDSLREFLGDGVDGVVKKLLKLELDVLVGHFSRCCNF